MLEYIDDYLSQAFLERFPASELIKFMLHLFIFPKPILEVLYINRLSSILHAEDLLIYLLSLFMLVKLNEPLHYDTNDQNMHEVVSHQEIYHKEDSRNV